MIRNFIHIAKVVRTARERTPYSQSDLSHLLGYKNGQFVSNIERSKCSTPINRVADLAKHLSIDPELIKEAMVKDYSESIDAAVANRLRTLALKEIPYDPATDSH